MARATARQMSFAYLELLRQGVRLEPLLQAIGDFLDKQPVPVERVRRDLVRGLRQPDHGRHGLTVVQVLRALVLMRVKNWDYRELRERIADGTSTYDADALPLSYLGTAAQPVRIHPW